MIRPRIILVIASSIDGRIAIPSGAISNLGSLEDKKILNDSLSKVDATIFGSGTLKTHKSNFLVKNYTNTKDIRLSNKQPISIVAGNPNYFSYDWQFFKQPLRRWLLNSTKYPLKDKSNFEKEFFFKEDIFSILKLLKKEGVNSIALLGGAKLIYSFALENLIDEIKITVVPRIIGGEYSWIPAAKSNYIFKTHQKWKLVRSEELSSNEIFLHYSKLKSLDNNK